MKKMRNLLLGTVAVVFSTVVASAAPPSGTWKINANGYTGNLVLNFDSVGNIGGGSNLAGDNLRGFWDEDSQRLVFYRLLGNNNSGLPPIYLQVFEGYLFPGGLAGSFEGAAATGASPKRNVFGWYATP